jgi:hypothetical protein
MPSAPKRRQTAASYIQEGGLPGFAQWALEAADTPDEAIRATRFEAFGLSKPPARFLEEKFVLDGGQQ